MSDAELRAALAELDQRQDLRAAGRPAAAVPAAFVPALAADMAALRPRRDAAVPQGSSGWLGTMVYAPPLRALGAAAAACDAWFIEGAAVRRGGSERVRWASGGGFSYGELRWPEPPAGGGFEEHARAAYMALFDALAAAGTPHTLRLWNYLPRINDCRGGLERYRRFNAGRQQAFIDAGRSAFEGAPAACALGSHDTAQGQLVLRFVAAREAPRAIENPRQVSAYRYPARYGAQTPTFSRAALADAGGGQVALFVSGTASIVGHESMHPGDVRAQVDETVRNLRVVIEQANAQLQAPSFALRDLATVVYVRHAQHCETVLSQLAQMAQTAKGAQAMPREANCRGAAVVMQADICRGELLVEIEGHAFVRGSLR